MNNGVSFFGYYGGKHHLAPLLCDMIPTKGVEIYIEAFGGGAHVLPNKTRHQTEIYNELTDELIAVFRCMCDLNKGLALQKRMTEISYSKEAFLYAQEHWRSTADEIERAALVLTLLVQSYNGAMKQWRNITTGFENLNYLTKIANMTNAIYRLDGVQVVQGDALDLIRKYKTRHDVCIYLDPPYLPETRGKDALKVYAHEMSAEQHLIMLTEIQQASCKIILSGYDSGLYRSYLTREAGWNWLAVNVTKSCQIKRGGAWKDFAQEMIWYNYDR